MQKVIYQNIGYDQLNVNLFDHFMRYQQVGNVWRKIAGKWVIEHHPFIDDWNKDDIVFLVKCLQDTITNNGLVYGAFVDCQLKGFVSVDGQLLDDKEKYIDLTSLHVSKDMRGTGIGRHLFNYAKLWASQKGAHKLYISAHSAVESQAFYQAMGCVEAKVCQSKHVDMEPFDCQLEYQLLDKD